MNGHPDNPRRAAWAKCRWLTGVTVGLWLLLGPPAYMLSGAAGLEGLSYAALLCLLPGLLVFALGAGYGAAAQQWVVGLVGMLVRMVFALGGLILIHAVRADLGIREFIVWVVVFYLVSLFVETQLLVRELRGTVTKQTKQHG